MYRSDLSGASVSIGLPVIIYRGAFSTRINRLVDQRSSFHAVLHTVDSWNEIELAFDLSGASIFAIDDHVYHQLSNAEKHRLVRRCEDRTIPLVIVQKHENIIPVKEEYVGIADVLRLDMIDTLLVDRIKSLLHKRECDIELSYVKNELDASRKRMDEYMYIVSHDFKAPLRGLASLTEFIAEELSGINLSKEVQDLLEMMKSRTDFMQKMVDDLLQFSRVTAHHNEKEPIKVKELINSVLSDNPSLHGVRLLVADNLPPIICDKVRLYEVLFQLIKNGVEFNDAAEPVIEITVSDTSDQLLFIVQDNGCGIKPEHHQRVFGLFQKLNAKEHSNGTGIGLTIVKTIVEQQNGKVWIESPNGLGTRVHFTWRK